MKDIFCLDIETIPHAQHREPYAPDDYWLKQEHLRRQATVWASAQPVVRRLPDFELQPQEYAMALTGQLPSTHPATAHVVSVSMTLDLGSTRPNLELPGMTDEAQVIQVDQFLHPVDVGGGETRPPKLGEIHTDEMLDAERKLLVLVFEKLAFAVRHNCTIVTFNGKGFDLPMLRWRATMLKVGLPRLSWYELLYPYRHKEHIDLRLLFSDGDRRARGTMAMWCTAFGIDAKTAGTGADVLGWVEKGDWNQLLSYGLDEMDDLIQLFRAVEGAL